MRTLPRLDLSPARNGSARLPCFAMKGSRVARKKIVENDSARAKRLAENTDEKIASRQQESDLLDERVRGNLRQHGA